MRDKTTDFIVEQNKTADFKNGTKPPILKTGQNRRFWKWDKLPEFKAGQNRRFYSGTKQNRRF